MTLDRQTLSGVAGYVSLACWIIVFTPQLYENWRRQSCEGLSVSFVVIWLLGDLFNVVGAILQKVLPTMIGIAVYYTLADILLLIQCYKYKGQRPLDSAASSVVDSPIGEEQPLLGSVHGSRMSQWRRRFQAFVGQPVVKETLIVLNVILCGILGYVFGNHSTPSDPAEPQPINFWGQVLGWVCAALYLLSRVPQILMNYRRKSTDGVAVLFFVFTLLGNVTYCLSIFLADSSKHALILNASWIVGALGSLLLDLAVLIQFYIYRR